MGMDMSKLLQQAQQMQEQVQKAQEEIANEIVEGSAGGGAVTVKATGGGKIVEIKISKDAIDPNDPETLEDLVLAAVNSALTAAEELAKSKLNLGALGDLGSLGLGF
jgi:DNA-binding YbaB/EbfC family protein